ncbi:uncharacterized protein EMH_0062910 [Eimeria mitis]|uniref:Uncharacterized protein n=1 Tax=Eimeria mitis TaxID=44415 RepID=U6JZX8_9EIME|nr:uncharacterized protein EMH_0062910 [Eimeria mitis]CDJ30974.1 hypothetical protein, conserved [Eimeria mitis]
MGEQLEKAHPLDPSKDSVPLASCLPDFALQPIRDEVVAVVWGTPLFWEALSVDAVCTLLAEYVRMREEEEASELLLRKAIVQAVLRREKSPAELLYHPAALHAAGLPHWKDDRLETEQRAALGNTKNERRLMRRVATTQEEYLSKSALARSLSKQPFFDSDIGVLVLLFSRRRIADNSKELRSGNETTEEICS